MEGNFTVVFEGKPIGKLQLVKKGLYYGLDLRCRRQTGQILRAVARWEGGWENLGIPVPEGDGLRLVKRIPVKRMGEGPWEFLLFPADADIGKLLTPEKAESPEEAEPGIPEPVLKPEIPAPVEEPVEAEPVPIPEPEAQPEVTAGEDTLPPDDAAPGQEQFYPISEEQPFDQLELVEQGILAQRDGQTGLLVQSSSDSPTGQWSEPMICE